MAQRKNIMHKRTFLKISALAAATMLSMPMMAYAENATLKVGFVGVTSGPAASWVFRTSARWKRARPG
jgi:uncharacterized protein YraI